MEVGNNTEPKSVTIVDKILGLSEDIRRVGPQRMLNSLGNNFELGYTASPTPEQLSEEISRDLTKRGEAVNSLKFVGYAGAQERYSQLNPEEFKTALANLGNEKRVIVAFPYVWQDKGIEHQPVRYNAWISRENETHERKFSDASFDGYTLENLVNMVKKGIPKDAPNPHYFFVEN